MYCSGCGQALTPGQPVCPRCGRPLAVGIPAVPGLGFQLENYGGKVRALSVVWYIYAGINAIVSFAGIAFARFFIEHGWRPMQHGVWMYGLIRPEWFGPAIMQFLWLLAALWCAFLFAVGWGLAHHEPWGRTVAIVAGFINLIKFFPVGTALGIWTLVVLMGYQNQALYDQLQ